MLTICVRVLRVRRLRSEMLRGWWGCMSGLI